MHFLFWNRQSFYRTFPNPFLLGSECSITCPLKNQQAYCKSSKGIRSFTCEKNGWSSNSKNDCECKTACSSPEEQFPHIGKGTFRWNISEFYQPVWIKWQSTCSPYNWQFSDVLPSFDSCSSVFKNAKCKAKCPANTYARNKNNAGSSILTKCSCQGQNCLWAVGKTIKPDLFCISEYRRSFWPMPWSLLTTWSFLDPPLSWPSILDCCWPRLSTFYKDHPFLPRPSTFYKDRPLFIKTVNVLPRLFNSKPIEPSIFVSTQFSTFDFNFF